MFKKYLALGSVCSAALAVAPISAQETTVALENWAFMPNYPAATVTDANTDSPTFVSGDGDVAWGVKFDPMDLSNVEDTVVITMQLTVDAGITGGNFRLGVFNDNGLLSAAAGDPPVFGGEIGGYTGYLWALSGGGHAPGHSGGAAGTGTVTGIVAADERNWVSTNGGYSLTPNGLMGPEEGASEEGGTFDIEIEIYRPSATTLDLTLIVTAQEAGFVWSDEFRIDEGAVAAELTSVNLIAFGDLNVDADNFEFANATVTGVPGEDTAPPQLFLGEFEIDELNNADTGEWLGWVFVEHDPWVYSYNLGSYLYVHEGSFGAAGSWVYAPRPAAAE